VVAAAIEVVAAALVVVAIVVVVVVVVVVVRGFGLSHRMGAGSMYCGVLTFRADDSK